MGFVVLVLVAVTAVYLYYKFFPNKIVDIAGLGTWVAVTGATDGIGKAFTHELAGKGYNVVLVSRSIDKLESCAKEIEETFHVATKVVQADFTSLDEQMYARINDELKGMDIGILVNNVGTVAPHPEYFLELENHHEDLFQGILNCNITSAVQMTRIVLPGMVSREKGLIINISSVLSELPAPLHTLYGATKSFLTKFSEDLDTEYNDKGVHVHVLKTGLVATKLSGWKRESFFVPSAQVYVKSALEETTKKRSCDGYIGHSILSSLVAVPIVLFPEVVGKIAMKCLYYMRNKQIKRCKECKPQAE